MANISDLLNKIKSARYGRDVRSAIYDSIDAMNIESANAYDAAITAQNSAQASAKAASGSVTSATEAAINAKKYSDSAKQYAESASVAIQAAYDTKTTTDKHITNAVDAPMMVTKFTKNLLNPALVTTTSNGVTCTKNSDGTYTLNGTATARTFFNINSNIPIIKGVAYKVVCIRDEDIDPGKFLSCVRRKATSAEYIFNNGTFIADTDLCWLWIEVEKDKTMNNVTIKPMLTTDLEATYDDYVPSSGYEIKTCGKNLLNIKKVTYSNLPDMSCAINDDQSIILNGTSIDNIGDIYFNTSYFTFEKGKKYIFSVDELKDKISIRFRLFGGYTSKIVLSTTNAFAVFAPTENITLYLSINFGGKITVNNLLIHIQIEEVENDVINPSTYEPYKESTVQIIPTTDVPLFDLKSFDGETNIISPGNVEVSHALTGTGKYVMQNMKDISDIKAAIVASGSTTE